MTEILHYHASKQGEQVAYTFLKNGKTPANSLTYGELELRAKAIAAILQSYLSPGDRALLLYPAGLDFLEAFFGCLYAGIIAVPAPAPEAVHLKRALPRLQAIVKDAGASIILTHSNFLSPVEKTLKQTELFEVKWLTTDTVDKNSAKQWQNTVIQSENLAYLQYTSGSTSTPKGVMISHCNLMAHLSDLKAVFRYTQNSITANWMPHHHDYGLVQGLLLPLYAGSSCYIMSPLAFIKNPIQWLKIISQYKITHSQGTNFAYAYCLHRYQAEKCQLLDLSSWCVAGYAAEPIKPKVMELFQKTFTPFGFKHTAFTPGYGLAETILCVTTGKKTDLPSYAYFEAKALLKNYVVEIPDREEATMLVGCGQPLGESTKIVIVHPETCLPGSTNEIGEIWVSGPAIAQGYWNRLEETQKTFHAHIAKTGEGPFLRTGDLGFFKNGELFVTGRLKDLIIIRGQNYYPQDIEQTVENSHPKLRVGRGAAFSIPGSVTEELVIVHEVNRKTAESDNESIIAAIREAVAQTHELPIYAVVLIKAGSLPITSSGKVQRHRCRQSFIEGTLEILARFQRPQRTVFLPDLKSKPSSQQRVDYLQALKTTSKRKKLLNLYLHSLLSYVMGIDKPDWIKDNQNLEEVGLDSVMSVELRSFLVKELERSLPINVLYLYPTINMLAEYLEKHLTEGKFEEDNSLKIQSEPNRQSIKSVIATQNEKKSKLQLLDWTVKNDDLKYDAPWESFLHWDQINTPPNKPQLKELGLKTITDDWTPKKTIIYPETKVLGMGSCFTRNIILWLAECGFNQSFPGSPYDAFVRYSTIGNNAYTAHQFRVLGSQPIVQDTLNIPFIKTKKFLDVEDDGGRELREILQQIDVLILTLGMTEVWYDNNANKPLMKPMPLKDYKPEQHSFKIESFSDTVQHLKTIDQIAKEYFPQLKIIFVMPIGRGVTFRPMSALNSASIQQSILRAALDEFLNTKRSEIEDRIFYFPNHEMISQFFIDPYQTDNIHITPYVTGKILSSFAKMYCSEIPERANSDLEEDEFLQKIIDKTITFSDNTVENEDIFKNELFSRISELETQNVQLQTVCDERLKVIQELDKAAKERLEIIQRLDAELKKQQ